MLGPTIDMIWVGKLGSAPIAGVGIAGIAVMAVSSIRMGLSTGTRAMIARFIGAGDFRGANHVAQQAFVISGAFSIFLALIGILLSETIMTLMGVEPEVVTEGATYMRIMFVGSLSMSFRFMTDGIMQASGDSVTPMKIAIFFRIFHIVLCPFLIFGWWIFPRLDVSGAALTNVISQSVGLGISFWVLFSGRSRLRPTLKQFRLDGDIIWRVVKIGIPSSVMGTSRSFGHLLLIRLLVPFGTIALAAHTLVQRIEMLMFMPCFGVGMAASVLTGQNLGANQPERAEKGGWQAFGLVETFIVICCLLIMFFAENIVRVFNTEPGVVEITSVFLRIATVSFLVIGFEAALGFSISGAGDTLPPMLITLISFWAVQIPLAWFLPQVGNLGVLGVRWAIAIGLVAAAIAYFVYFKMGRWKYKLV